MEIRCVSEKPLFRAMVTVYIECKISVLGAGRLIQAVPAKVVWILPEADKNA